ncbi:MAG: alpha/beta hydrolase [Planctomycetaceae bacterium]|nr:alpha/beta hydrolase [Planctomycetaceae bacterium]
MQKFMLAIAALALGMAAPLLGGEANSVQAEVWGRYLSSAEQTALTSMIPAKTVPATDDPNSQDAIQALRDGFAAAALDYAADFADIPRQAYNENGVKGTWITPANANTDQVFLYLHGGAYVFGSDRTPTPITAFLAREAGVRCFSLDYPLAPEPPYPAAVDNAVQAYRMMLESGIEAGNIVIGGDSAGGGLSLALLQALREIGLPMPAGAYLISPWADLCQSLETQTLKSGVDMGITTEMLTDWACLYAPDTDRRNPLISPVNGTLRGLPPLLIHVGSHEVLLDDSLTLARNAALADVPLTLKVWPGYPHVFQWYHRDLEGGRTALREAARFIVAAIEGTVVR